ncbi:thiopeptide-type bacteriocin biosynthesis protein [Micromonospora sp. WMMA1363]|nr:lantibiotic dehydratase [Micromonospora sp. WMMA1363]MDM4723395.1 thiopeptide-type bacteriocin biosynthesis protein [Micromonospora sp. WMMA1363]
MQPIVRFLTEASTALARPCTVFDWGAAADLPFLPAVRNGRTVLAPARWHLPAEHLPGRDADWTTWRDGLAAWRETVRCPHTVYLGTGDQRISLDLTEPAHQALLRDHLTRTDTALLRAAPASGSAGWIGGHAHEIVIPLAATTTPIPPPRWADTVVDVRAHGHLPGDPGRLYLKLYGHPDRQAAVLTRHLPTLLATLDADVRWWFLRYGDPDPHLRLRLTGPVDAPRIAGWARELRHAGLIAHMQADTDYPETARFGGPAALAAAEAYFAADSAAALTQLTTTEARGGPDLRAMTAASLLDLTLAAIGDTRAGLRWLTEHTRTHGRRQPAKCTNRPSGSPTRTTTPAWPRCPTAPRSSRHGSTAATPWPPTATSCTPPAPPPSPSCCLTCCTCTTPAWPAPTPTANASACTSPARPR